MTSHSRELLGQPRDRNVAFPDDCIELGLLDVQARLLGVQGRLLRVQARLLGSRTKLGIVERVAGFHLDEAVAIWDRTKHIP